MATIADKKPPQSKNIIKILFKNGQEKTYRVEDSVKFKKQYCDCTKSVLNRQYICGTDILTNMNTIIMCEDIVAISFYS